MARTFHVPPHPGSSGAAVSSRMSALRRRDTAPEVAIRKLLHAAGRRYRVAYRVPGNARRTIDIAFTRAKVAVFVDGCFWHGCTEHGTRPTSNTAWWQSKLAANQARDADTTALLADQGWTVLRFWEHEPPEAAASRILTVLTAASASVQHHEHTTSSVSDGPAPGSHDCRHLPL